MRGAAEPFAAPAAPAHSYWSPALLPACSTRSRISRCSCAQSPLSPYCSCQLPLRSGQWPAPSCACPELRMLHTCMLRARMPRAVHAANASEERTKHGETHREDVARLPGPLVGVPLGQLVGPALGGAEAVGHGTHHCGRASGRARGRAGPMSLADRGHSIELSLLSTIFAVGRPALSLWKTGTPKGRAQHNGGLAVRNASPRESPGAGRRENAEQAA